MVQAEKTYEVATVRQINNLRVSHRLALFGVVLIVPLLIATVVLVKARNAQIDG